MCLAGQMPAAPATAAEAMAMVQAGLGWLATADAASLPAAVQAGLPARAGAGVVDAHRGAVTGAVGVQRPGRLRRRRARLGADVAEVAAPGSPAAPPIGALGWMRRLAAHRAVGDALAAGEISESWARQICDWTDALPEDVRGDADVILLGAAAGGADLADLGALAEELRKMHARPDTDGDDGFADRSLQLDTTFQGAGKLDGNLTPQCTAALQAVLDALGKRRGPEDLRTKGQRQHDALEDACRRLVGSGCLPERAGQPTQIVLHMDLDRLRGLPGAPEAEAAWAGQATAGPGDDCDAQIVPVVTGRIDPGVLDRLAAALLHGTPPWPAQARHRPHPPPSAPQPLAAPATRAPAPPPQTSPATPAPARRARAERAARRMILEAAADLLSGPGGLASYLRTRLAPGTVASVSLPLDVGARPRPSRCICAARWPCATGAAASRAATSRWRPASRTTSSPAPRAARPA